MPDTVKPENILDRLLGVYPQVPSFLRYSNGFELLIAVILSAQCTDAMVNRITPRLFSRFPTPGDLAGAPLEVVEDIVHSTGFYRAKAANIRETARMLAEHHGGLVPESFEDLLKLPGVGRKTAHVVRGTLFGKPAVIVDTHFKRVVYRLGMTRETEPEKVEADLASRIPPEIQYRFSMAANTLGREYCKARSPQCGDCPLGDLCPSAFYK